MKFSELDLYQVLCDCPNHFSSKYFNMSIDWCLDQYEVLMARGVLTRYTFDNESHFKSIIYISVDRLYQNFLRDSANDPEFVSFDSLCPADEDGSVDLSRCSALADSFDDIDDSEVVFDFTKAWFGFHAMDPRAAKKMFQDLPDDLRSYLSRSFEVVVNGESKVLDHLCKGGLVFTDGSVIRSYEGTSLTQTQFAMITSYFSQRSKLSGFYSRLSF